MKAEEIRGMSVEDMRARVAELEEERFRLKFRSATETLEDPLRLRSIRRDIARLYTIVRERELRGDAPVTSTAGKTATKTTRRRATATKTAGTTAAAKAAAKKTNAKSAAKKSATKSASKTAAKKAASKTASKKTSSETAS